MILTHAEHNSPYLAGSFSLSYRVQLKSDDLTIRENSTEILETTLTSWVQRQPGRGGGYSTNFYTAEAHPLNLLYTIFHDFVFLLLTNGTPFTYLA